MKIAKTLIAAAFAAASFVPGASVGATTGGDAEILGVLDSVEVTIQAPTIGSKVGMKTCTETYSEGEVWNYDCPDTKPTIIVPSGAHYTVSSFSSYITGYPSNNPTYDEWFTGTFEADTDYYVEVGLSPEEGYLFDITGNYDFDAGKYVITSNVTPHINGVVDYELSDYNFETQYMFYAKVRAVEGSATDENTTTDTDVTTANVDTGITYETLEGDSQTFYTASDSALTFRFDIDYAEFQESGLVYVDGNLISADNYTSKSGSTIITLNDSYTNTLAAGKHTIYVSTDNGHASATFTIKKSANPKTGINVAASATLLTIGLVGLAGTAIYTVKSKRA